ncbi:FtsK/SpoIIIE domain-containing protein [Frankia gtarii]|uniref:FtsK/SpoIIIE domain-containing protein n=1 Tax=Frankia gtarii TaxID=2950102 RepID=UPI0021C00087|nr:FtsK/SpoIIIE domain-containing protein [Frankia gtarii]
MTSIAGFFWRYRSELLPLYIGLFLTVSAAVAHRAWGTGGVVLLTLFFLVTACLFARRLTRRVERAYAVTAAFLGSGWWSTAAIFGPGHGPFPALLITVGSATAIPWWAHRRRRERVRVERTIRAWPVLAEDAGLSGSRVMSAVVDAWGYTARVALRRGMSARSAIARADEIASMLGVRPNSVRVTADPDREDHVIVRVTESDPLARPNPWPGHGDQAATITKPIAIGTSEDGTTVTVLLLRRHILIGGVVGSGKSGIVNAILAGLVPADDVIIWGVDLKGGMELGPWAKSLGRLATDMDGAVKLFADAMEELNRRTREQAQRGERTWNPTRERPALVILVDEFAELPPEALEIADSFTRLGRAVAATLIAATQRPTQDAMGNNAVRSQMDGRIALRVRERADTDLILGAGAYKSGWRTDTFTLPGAFLILDPDHNTPIPNRAYLVEDDTVTDIAARYPAPTALPVRQDEPRADHPVDPDDALWTALTMPEGASVSDLMTATSRSRRWVYYALQQLQDAGKVRQTGGRWHATPDQP